MLNGAYLRIAQLQVRLSWVDIQRLVIESVARDGEVLVVKVRNFDNPFGFAVQIIEADHLDEDFNLTLANGNRIIMSRLKLMNGMRQWPTIF